jgi:excisionase family DNA binding protein
MKGLFYSTGQVARQLGTTQATVRVLCENGLIAADTTPGGQWRIPASEVERLKRDGVPPIPRLLPAASSQLVRYGTR